MAPAQLIYLRARLIFFEIFENTDDLFFHKTALMNLLLFFLNVRRTNSRLHCLDFLGGGRAIWLRMLEKKP